MTTAARSPSIKKAHVNPLKRDKDERLVVFTDLDLTLFDSSKARKNAARQAVSALNLKITTEEALGAYEDIVTHLETFKAMGVPNFKILWNSPKLYVVLM